MKLYMLRHGRTPWNAEGKLQGRTDIPLSEEGRASARETREQLQNITFDAAFSSPLQRARETAEIILGEKAVEVCPDERLIELSFGAAEGTCISDLEEDEQPTLHLFGSPEAYEPPEGGESYAALLERCERFLREEIIPHAGEWKNVLIVAHGGTVRGLFSAMFGAKSNEIYGSRVQKNCAVNIVDYTDGVYRLDVFANEFCDGV